MQHGFRSNNFGLKRQCWNCAEALDGKNIAINKAANSVSVYHNYKGLFSKVLLDLVNGKKEFITVDIFNHVWRQTYIICLQHDHDMEYNFSFLSSCQIMMKLSDFAYWFQKNYSSVTYDKNFIQWQQAETWLTIMAPLTAFSLELIYIHPQTVLKACQVQ